MEEKGQNDQVNCADRELGFQFLNLMEAKILYCTSRNRMFFCYIIFFRSLSSMNQFVKI